MKIEAKSLKEELDQGDILLIDVRTPAEFGGIHIEGSRLMPLDRLDPAELPERDCVLVCGTGKRAGLAMERLQAAGRENLRVLVGGLSAWQEAGLPVKRGKAAISLERQVRIAAGLLVLAGVILGTWAHPAFYLLSGFVGAGLIFAGITDWCGMAVLLARAPWNQRG